jgi:ATP-dependent DNA helicase RecQ
VETSRITKAVLVIDEAQDMDRTEFGLIRALMERNDQMRVIAVGDDDQNIYQWRGSDSAYMSAFLNHEKALQYNLIRNYRSKSNLVSFTNQFVQTIGKRLKQIPIEAYQPDHGKIKIIHYRNGNLITPLVEDILSTDLSGTTCVLTHRNEEAFQVAGLLTKEGVRARLIQSNDDFSLCNLEEVRFFLGELKLDEGFSTIAEEVWNNAKRRLAEKYKGCPTFELCKNLIKDFEATNTKRKYKSDLEVYIRESKLEDFTGENSETILVSTIHKAKGKEFDNVFLMLDNFDARLDDQKRQLYVAMTRAKQRLVIHLNGNYLDHIKTEALERVEDPDTYPSPGSLIVRLSHKDLHLGYFEYVQKRIHALISGEPLFISEEGCKNKTGELVLKFSKSFLNAIEERKKNGYQPVNAKVNFIVYWKDEEKDKEVKIVLPEMQFEKSSPPEGADL